MPNFVIENLHKPWNWKNISKNKFGDDLVRWYEYPDFVENQRIALNNNFYPDITGIILSYVKNERVIRPKIQDDDTFMAFPCTDYERDEKSEEQILGDTKEHYQDTFPFGQLNFRVEDTKILGSICQEYMTSIELYGNPNKECLLLKREGENPNE